MKKKAIGILGMVLLSSVMLTACGSDKDDMGMNMNQMKGVQKMDITFTTNPKPLKVNQEGILQANVAAGGKPKPDVTVEIETWADGDNNHEKEKATSDNKGGFTLHKTFTKAGTYHAVVHTTSSELHQMPSFEFQVVAK